MPNSNDRDRSKEFGSVGVVGWRLNEVEEDIRQIRREREVRRVEIDKELATLKGGLQASILRSETKFAKIFAYAAIGAVLGTGLVEFIVYRLSGK